MSLPGRPQRESRPLSCHCTNLHPLLSVCVISFCLYLSLSVSLSICDSTWLCVSACICVCVSLQEAELAARILLDQGQVTAWGLPSQGRRRGSLSRAGEGCSPLCSLPFQSSPFPSPSLLSLPSSFSQFLSALPPFRVLFHPRNHFLLFYLPEPNSC